MENKKEITAIDYDRLLMMFCSTDRYRPAMQQPNTVGDVTYATDGVWTVIVPNCYLRGRYPAHEKAPNYKSVLDSQKKCATITYKDTDLFKAMQVHPKVHDVAECDDCEGEGECPHCGKDCDTCNGKGEIVDRSLPMVLTKDAAIQINEHRFSPHRLAILEKTVAMMMVDTFELISFSGEVSLFRVGPVQVLLTRLSDAADKLPNYILSPANTTND